MSLKGERTDITYDENRRIVQLDAFVPELEPRESFVSIDIVEFSKNNPILGPVLIYQEVEEQEGPAVGRLLDYFKRPQDRLFCGPGVSPEEIKESEDYLYINQYIGRLGHGAVAVAVTFYDTQEAAEDAQAAIEQEMELEFLLDKYMANPN
ncbi:MAG: hypothetical protein NVS1B10_04940 [Candidatus Saccharimonadales bacterium]